MLDAQPENLPEGLQQRLRAFEEASSEYKEQQRGFLEAKAETARLRKAAEALEAEASAANTSWKAMAKLRTIDQRKINSEIENSVRLKEQGDALRRTADVREELHGELRLGLFEARRELAALSSSLNHGFQEHRLRELLATPGLKEVVSEIFKISRRRFLDNHDPLVSYETEAEAKKAIICGFFETLGLDERGAAPVLTWVPDPVSGEIVGGSMISMKRLREAGGDPAGIAGLSLAK